MEATSAPRGSGAGGRAGDRTALEPGEQLRAHGQKPPTSSPHSIPNATSMYLRSEGLQNIATRSPRRATGVDKGRRDPIYFAPLKHDCDACMLKPKCCPNMPCAQDRALRSRSRSRQGPCDRQDGGLRRLMSRTKEGRDALRSSEAHPQARSIAPPWPKRSQGRVPISRHRPKSPETGEAHPSSRSRPSPCEAKSQDSASLTSPQIPSAGARTGGSSTKSTLCRPSRSAR